MLKEYEELKSLVSPLGLYYLRDISKLTVLPGANTVFSLALMYGERSN